MYAPEYKYNDKLVQNLVKLESSKTVLNSLDLSYNVRQKLIQKVRAIDIFHLAHMLKLELSIKDAEKILNSVRIEGIDEVRYTLIRNFKNVLDFNRSNIADTYSELDRAVVLHVNKLMLTQWRETWESNFRSFNDRIDDRWDNYLKFRNDELPVNEIENEIEGLIDWYKYSIPTITPVIRMAITFYRFIQISPFTAANKYTIAAMIDYLMLKNGFSSKIYSSPLRMLDNNENEIVKTLEIVKKAKDISYWIDMFVNILLEDLLSTREDINDFIAQEEKSKQQPFLNLNKRQLKILKYLQNVPTIKREDYCHMMEVSTMTAFRDLNDLVRKKLLKIDGLGRGTKYKLASM